MLVSLHETVLSVSPYQPPAPYLLQVAISRDADRVTIVLTGEVDISTLSLVYDEITDIIGDLKADLIIDMERVTFLDSYGLAFLVTTDTRMKSQGARLVIFAPTPEIRRLLDAAGLTPHLMTEPDAPRISHRRRTQTRYGRLGRQSRHNID